MPGHLGPNASKVGDESDAEGVQLTLDDAIKAAEAEYDAAHRLGPVR